MAWPQSQDYNEALQNPQTSFGDAELRGGQAATNAMGMPMPPIDFDRHTMSGLIPARSKLKKVPVRPHPT